MQATTFRRSWWLFVPPPPLFALSFVAGTSLGRALGLHLGDGGASSARVVGAVVIAAGAAFVVTAPAMFAWNRTTIVPHGTARTLLTGGPYRLTRNPMYVGLVLLYLGVALVLNQLGPLVVLVLPLWILSTKTIPYEEAVLGSIFGAQYRAYTERVRRWL